MKKKEARELIREWKVGQMKGIRIGLSTREIVRLDLNKFEINDTTDWYYGWMVAYVNREELAGVLTGEIELINLDWN